LAQASLDQAIDDHSVASKSSPKMKSSMVLALLPAMGTAQDFTAGSMQVNDPAYVAHLNAVEDSLWTAAPQDFFEGLTFEDARVMLGARLSDISLHLNATLPDSAYRLADDELPLDFDARKQWENLIHPIRNQQRCGSCWAFSASEVLSDRVAIASGKPSPVLSAEDLVSCDKRDHGCGGGYLPAAWQYLTTTGIVTDACFPYSAGGGRPAACATSCVDAESFVRTKADHAYAIKGAANMQKDLLQNGPIQVGFIVYRSFMLYSHGVYHKHPKEQEEGGHAVKIVGWGVEGKGKFSKYWTVANSWDTNWGEDGFFRIVRGRNECGIETMGPPYAGMPQLAQEEIVV